MDYLSKEELELVEATRMHREENRRLSEIIQYLGFKNVAQGSYESPAVSARELWEILSDENKRKKLISLVKNKAFW